jgi:hypothetical protein
MGNTEAIDPAQSFNVSETASNGTSLGNVMVLDADAGTTFSNWTITGGNTDGIFAINSGTGALTVADNSNLDFETTTSYVLSVTVSDGANTSSVETVSVSITDENDSTPVVDPAHSFNVSETAANGTSLGLVTATDSDAGTTFSNWSITGGNTDGIFAINSGTGVLTVSDNSNLDFETTTSYVLSVTVSDGANTSSVETVSVSITDENDNTPVVDPAQSFNVSEIATNGTSVGTVTATDADAGTVFSNWTITGGNTDGIFAINSGTGALTVSDNSNLDFETTTSYVLSVTVSDGSDTSSIETVGISVTNENDNAPVSAPDSYSVAQGTTLNVASAAGVLANDSDADGSPLTEVR